MQFEAVSGQGLFQEHPPSNIYRQGSEQYPLTASQVSHFRTINNVTTGFRLYSVY